MTYLKQTSVRVQCQCNRDMVGLLYSTVNTYMQVSLMNQPPFFWNHRLSTLVIVLCAKTEFRLDQSNCRSPVR